MGIIIHHRDYDIEVSTEAELRTVLGVLGSPQLPLMAVNGIAPVAQGGTPSLDGLWASATNDGVREYLRVLAQHPRGVNDTLFRELLSLTDNAQLGARTAAVVRTMKRANADPVALLIRTKDGRVGNLTYTYRLEEGLAEVINRG